MDSVLLILGIIVLAAIATRLSFESDVDSTRPENVKKNIGLIEIILLIVGIVFMMQLTGQDVFGVMQAMFTFR